MGNLRGKDEGGDVGGFGRGGWFQGGRGGFEISRINDVISFTEDLESSPMSTSLGYPFG